MSDSAAVPTALVAGATGTLGFSLTRYLAREKGWNVLALSRRISADSFPEPGITPVPADMLSVDSLREALAGHSPDYLFYAAGINREKSFLSFKAPTQARFLVRASRYLLPLLGIVPALKRMFYKAIAESSGAYDRGNINLLMLRNVVQATQAASPDLKHICMVTGGKYYGVHLSPMLHPKWEIPFREEMPRSPGPNFYYEQEDYLRAIGRPGLIWSVIRPHFIIGYSRFSFRNLLTTLAVYASLQKAAGSKLIFPGDRKAWEREQEMSDAKLIAEMMAWTVATPEARNQAFNVVNGVPMRWREIWPVLADAMGMEWEMKPGGFNFTGWLDSHAHLWPELVKTHDLQPSSLESLCSAQFLCKSMIPFWDERYSMDKARRTGFDREVDNAEMFPRYIRELRAERVIP